MSEKLFKEETDLYRRFLEKCHITSVINNHLADLDLSVNPYKEISAKEVVSYWRKFIKNPNRKGHLNFYNHIPFCPKACHFCCYFKTQPTSSEINLYVKDLIKYYDFFSPIFKDKNFTNLYFGGGTPSILKEKEMKDLLTSLFNLFEFDDDGQKVMEFNPATSSKGKLKLLKDFGFNKVSFGVQTFNQETLRLNNRGYQTPEMVKEAVSDAKDLGFEIVNIDLLFGLYGDTSKDLIENMKRSLDLNPDTIHLYSLQPTRFYLNEFWKMKKDDFFEHKKKIIESTSNKICNLAKMKGYDVPDFSKLNLELSDPNAYLFSKEKAQRRKYYSFGDRDDRNHVFGIGYKSVSHINGVIRYEANDKISVDPSDYIYLGTVFDEKREMIAFILRNLSYRKFIKFDNFKNNFGKDITEEFGEAIEKLEKIKAISIQEDRIEFCISDPKERLLYSLFFFGSDKISKALELFEKGRLRRSVNIGKKLTNDEMKKRKEIDKKISSVILDNEDKILKVIDGILIKRGSNGLVVKMEENGGKKEIKLRTDKTTLFVNTIASGENLRIINDEVISFDKIREGDSLSMITYGSEGKLKALIVKRITG